MTSWSKCKQEGLSLRWSLYVLIVVCWVLPLLVTLFVTGSQMSRSIRTRMENTVSFSADHASSLLQERLKEAMAASRTASYDNKLRSLYDTYRSNNNPVALYNNTTKYLTSQYAYNNLFEATYLYYPDGPESVSYSLNGSVWDKSGAMQHFKADVLPLVKQFYPTLDTGIRFFLADGRLYMMRNLVNSNFDTFGVLVMRCNISYLAASVRSIVWLRDATVELDGISLDVVGQGVSRQAYPEIYYDRSGNGFAVTKSASIEDHGIQIRAMVSDDLLKTEQRSFYSIFLFMLLGLGVLFALLIHFFFRNISQPIDVLMEATDHLEQGDLGYHAGTIPKSREFRALTLRFNRLSDRLKEQFERNNMEQIALHDARIKALQSQINPHFLNNTLELINWEARMAQNDKVSHMIESLSVMLNAAMARGGKATVNMREELSYIDAYLYIISQRFGDRLQVVRDIEPMVWLAEVPRLILQPIVENAIEHGISQRSKGELEMKLYLDGNWLVMDVEHDGQLTDSDRATIENLLEWDGQEMIQAGSSRIGIRNVNQRLKILCGPGSGLTITTPKPGKVLSRIRLPFLKSDN